MAEKIKIELGDVQKTLLFPSWGRVIETKKPMPLLVDNVAVNIMSTIDYDFTLIGQNFDESNQLSWVIRYLNIDRTIQKILNEFPSATIVNIGCGLDSTFERVDNGILHWYDLDMPDSIALRRRFMKETERNHFISCSVFDTSWFDLVIPKEKLLFVASGVLYYFEEDKIKELFLRLIEKFPGSEIIFDAVSPLGVKYSNKMIIKNGGMDDKSFLKWGLSNAKEIEKWNNKIKVLEEYPYYSNLPSYSGIGLKARIKIWLSDVLRTAYMVHLKFGSNS